MTRSDFELFLTGGMVLCAVMALIMLARIQSKGTSALVQAAAFLALGGVLYLQKIEAPQNIVIGGFVVVGLLLATDMVIRASRQGGPP